MSSSFAIDAKKSGETGIGNENRADGVPVEATPAPGKAEKK